MAYDDQPNDQPNDQGANQSGGQAGDQTITCRDCGSDFVWSAGEQEFYASKNLSAPTRCKDCRAKKRAERNDQRGGMGGQRQMYDITCSNCGQAGQVPFQPKTDDVLCRDCFEKKRNGELAA